MSASVGTSLSVPGGPVGTGVILRVCIRRCCRRRRCLVRVGLWRSGFGRLRRGAWLMVMCRIDLVVVVVVVFVVVTVLVVVGLMLES